MVKPLMTVIRAVVTRGVIVSQLKKRMLFGALILHSSFAPRIEAWPRKRALYAEAVEYVPEEHHFQTKWSGTPGCTDQFSSH
jgi:hypothetical protein